MQVNFTNNGPTVISTYIDFREYRARLRPVRLSSKTSSSAESIPSEEAISQCCTRSTVTTEARRGSIRASSGLAQILDSDLPSSTSNPSSHSIQRISAQSSIREADSTVEKQSLSSKTTQHDSNWDEKNKKYLKQWQLVSHSSLHSSSEMNSKNSVVDFTKVKLKKVEKVAENKANYSSPAQFPSSFLNVKLKKVKIPRYEEKQDDSKEVAQEKANCAGEPKNTILKQPLITTTSQKVSRTTNDRLLQTVPPGNQSYQFKVTPVSQGIRHKTYEWESRIHALKKNHTSAPGTKTATKKTVNNNSHPQISRKPIEFNKVVLRKVGCTDMAIKDLDSKTTKHKENVVSKYARLFENGHIGQDTNDTSIDQQKDNNPYMEKMPPTRDIEEPVQIMQNQSESDSRCLEKDFEFMKIKLKPVRTSFLKERAVKG